MTVFDTNFTTVYATWDDDPAQHEPFLVCRDCNEKLCSVEEGDVFDTLAAVVREHECVDNELDPDSGLPSQLHRQIQEALGGDSNDAEHDALYAVAEHFGIDFETEDDHRYNPAPFCAKCGGPCEMDPS